MCTDQQLRAMPPCTRKTGRAVDHAKSLLSEHFAQLINFCDKNHIVDMDKWQQDHLSQDSELLARKYGSYGRVYIVKQGGKTVAYKVLRLQCDPYFSLPHISRGISELLTVINELRIQRAVSGIPGFAKLLKAHVVAGELPELFLEAEEETLAWAGEGWFEAGFPADSPLWLTQVFLVTSMEYAGEGSKAHIFLDGQNTVKQVKDITALGAALLGQIEALAEGEIRCEFMVSVHAIIRTSGPPRLTSVFSTMICISGMLVCKKGSYRQKKGNWGPSRCSR